MAMVSIHRANMALPARGRTGADWSVPVHHHGGDAWEGAGRLRAHRHRLGLDVIHLISIPITNTSVNPARSTGPALFVGGWALDAALALLGRPILGGIAGGPALPLDQSRAGRSGDGQFAQMSK